MEKLIKIVKKNKIVTAIIVLLIIILVILAVIQNIKAKEKEYTTVSEFNSVRELLEYLGCQYYSEKKSKTEGFSTDIFLKFDRELYTDGESNETFFRYIPVALTEASNFQSIRLIDERNEIVMEIKADAETKTIEYAINGRKDYFKYMDSLKSMENYTEDKMVSFDIESQELKNTIQQKWTAKNINYGSKESTYDKYDIYLEEGIKVRNTNSKVYNIIFTTRYNKEVVDGIKVGESKEKIIEKLGKPNFGGIDKSVLGYISKDFYIFFLEDEISVYRIDREISDSFSKLLDEFIGEKDVKAFMNKLTDIWSDYDIYNYDTNYLYITYPSKGVEIGYNHANGNGIKIYRNFSGKIYDEKSIKDVLNNNELPDEIFLVLDKDLIYEKEQMRMLQKSECIRSAASGEEEIDKDNKSNKFFITYELNYKSDLSQKIKVKFLSKTQDYASSELDESISVNSYKWINDDNILYSVKEEGIYLYNAVTRKNTNIIKGTSEFEIKFFENNILKYDDKEVKVNI